MIWLKLIACIGAVLLLCCYWVLADYKEIQRTHGTNVLNLRWHRLRWLAKAAEVAVVCLVFGSTFRPLTVNWWQVGAFGLFSMALWWCMFDYWLSKKRGRNPWYIGQNAMSDLFLQMLKEGMHLSDEAAHLVVKVPVLAVTFVILLFTII